VFHSPELLSFPIEVVVVTAVPRLFLLFGIVHATGEEEEEKEDAAAAAELV
jgi:hypothetical protein